MFRYFHWTAVAVILGLSISLGLLTGCHSSAPQEKAKAPPPAALRPAKNADPEGLKDLSPADRALAERQAVCPVSDEPLGSMGAPVKVTVRGRTVFLCCEGCEEQIQKEPDKYLAKLNLAK
jgi:YHS domain-containing protein